MSTQGDCSAGPSSDGAAGMPSGGTTYSRPKVLQAPNFDFFPRRRKAPPPFKCGKGSELEYFFRTFEKYVSREYSDDEEDWRLVLPEYLEGDILKAARSFKAHERYCVIKARLLKDFATPGRITGTSYSDLLDAKKESKESLGCFRIRLEGMIEGLGVDDSGRRALIIKALERNTEESILTDIKKLRVVTGDLSVERYVELYNDFSKLTVSKPDVVAALEQPAARVAHSDRVDVRPPVICFRCNREGHFARDCTMSNLNLKCYVCHQPGHVMRQCPGQTSNNVRPILYCGFCGRPGHAMVHCREFNEYRGHDSNFSPPRSMAGGRFSYNRGMRGSARFNNSRVPFPDDSFGQDKNKLN